MPVCETMPLHLLNEIVGGMGMNHDLMTMKMRPSVESGEKIEIFEV